MGESYILIPIQEDVLTWLSDNGITPPPSFASRYPTPCELLAAAASLPGYRCRASDPTATDFWHIEVESLQNPEANPWAFLTVHPFADMATPGPVAFERGWPEVILPIAIDLARQIGPFILQPSSGSRPLLIDATTIFETAYDRWCSDD